MGQRLATGLAIASAALLFASVAFYNGYPLVWYDTSSHIADALLGRIHWARSVYYSLFMAAVHWRISLWPVVLVQSLIVAHLVHLVSRVTLGAVRPAVDLGIALALTCTSSLPWFAGQLMPEVFTGVVILGMFLLGLARERLTRPEAIYVFILTALAIAIHYSHVALAFGLAVAFSAARAIAWPGMDLRRTASTALACGGAVALAAAALVGSHVVDSGRVGISPYWQIFLLARFAADGPAAQYLDENCPERGFALCDHTGELPAAVVDFLWRPEGLLHQLGGVDALREEAREIVLGSLAAAPLWHLELALRNTAKQLRSVRFPADLHPYLETDSDGGEYVPRVIREHLPADHPRYLASRQQTGRLPVEPVWRYSGRVGKGAAAAAALLTLWFAAVSRRSGQGAPQLALAFAVAAGLVLNAMATGPISEPHSRYGARATWPLALYVWLGLVSLGRRPRRRLAPRDGRGDAAGLPGFVAPTSG